MEHYQTIWFCRDELSLAMLFWEDMIALISMLEVLLFLMSIWTFILYHLDLNIHATIKKFTLRIMLGSIPHQKFSFYHLPTRGRAGIKLGDAWYVSNVSIIFYCSMLLYYLFWMSMGFILHIYIIFGTNLLTGGRARIAVFLPISVFRRKGISNGVQTEWNLWERDFWNERDPEDLECKSRSSRGVTSPASHYSNLPLMKVMSSWSSCQNATCPKSASNSNSNCMSNICFFFHANKIVHPMANNP